MEILLLGKDINLISISFSYNFNRLLPVRPNYPSTVLEVLKAHINDVIVIEMQPWDFREDYILSRLLRGEQFWIIIYVKNGSCLIYTEKTAVCGVEVC